MDIKLLRYLELFKKKNQYIAVVITQHNQIVLIPKINTKFDIRIYIDIDNRQSIPEVQQILMGWLLDTC